MTSYIDAHHHVWDLAARPQPWMVGEQMAPVRRNFGMADLATATIAHQITGTVLVQAVADITETEELLDLAEQHPLIAGVVGYVDVGSPDVGEQLDRLQQRRTGRWLVGIRSLVQYEADPRWLLRPFVLDGLRAVAARDLTHDLLIVPNQIAGAVEAVSIVEEGRFVVDHLAKPPIASGEIEPWANAFGALARRENTTAKLSGLVTEADWATWTEDQLRPYVDHALDTFGPNRLMFGSDWPVCTLAATYDRVVDSLLHLTSELSPDERAALFGGNARSIYSLHEEQR